MDLLVAYNLHYVLSFLVVLTVVVFVHELGHYWVARRNGVRIEVFSIGFGPELFARNDRHGTRWRVGAIPFGGYVRMFGDADESSRPDTEREMTDEEKAVAFPHKRLGQRAAIVAAGPIANFIFAILLFWGLFMAVGKPFTPPVVGEVRPGSAAEAAGMKAGDRIVGIDSAAIERFEQIQGIVRFHSGGPLHLRIERGGAALELEATPIMSELTDRFGNVHKVPLLGISVASGQTESQRLGPGQALLEGVATTFVITERTLQSLWQMILGVRGVEDLGGPLRIAKYSGEAAQGGFLEIVYFIALLSVNLGLINLFPIPMMDGGHLAFYAAEGVLRRPLGVRTQEYGFRIGLILILFLTILATWNDLVHLKVWDFVKGLIS